MGALVLIQNNKNDLNCQWSFGRLELLHAGNDSIERTDNVRIKDELEKRLLPGKVVILLIDDDSNVTRTDICILLFATILSR